MKYTVFAQIDMEVEANSYQEARDIAISGLYNNSPPDTRISLVQREIIHVEDVNGVDEEGNE